MTHQDLRRDEAVDVPHEGTLGGVVHVLHHLLVLQQPVVSDLYLLGLPLLTDDDVEGGEVAINQPEVVHVVDGAGQTGGHLEPLLPPDLVETLHLRVVDESGQTVTRHKLRHQPEVEIRFVCHQPVVAH